MPEVLSALVAFLAEHRRWPCSKKCNADASAKALKGDDRKTFMSECLKG